MAIINCGSGEVLGGESRAAARQAAEFAFCELRLNTLEILTAIFDGIQPNRIELHGAMVDAVVYKIVTSCNVLSVLDE